MAFTRFHDDPCRIQKALQESTGPGRYSIDVPGNGISPSYMEDPYIRLQKWGGNLRSNTINLESALLGIGNTLNRDYTINKSVIPVTCSQSYPSQTSVTEQPRATEPAWMIRDVQQHQFQYLPLDPQENIQIPFQHNLNTQLIERDNYTPQINCNL